MREQLLKDIIDIETGMFRRLNIGESMLEDRIPPFRMMRWMTHSVQSGKHSCDSRCPQ